jgi:hypothetical protein
MKPLHGKVSNLHILILILLNGHKISCPQQQLDTEALSQSETFCEEYSVFKTVAFLPYHGDWHIPFLNLIFY